MTDFEFDPVPSPGTNRTATTTDCPTCGGDRFVPAHADTPVVADGEGGYTDAYMRCPSCNVAVREPIPVDAWWK